MTIHSFTADTHLAMPPTLFKFASPARVESGSGRRKARERSVVDAFSRSADRRRRSARIQQAISSGRAGVGDWPDRVGPSKPVNAVSGVGAVGGLEAEEPLD
jgi:hypothetical protein